MESIINGKKILIVDDSVTQRKNLKNIFEKYNAKIYEAENGIEGIKKAFEVFPDIIISDVVMPEMNGYGLSFLLTHNEFTSHIPIIILTSQDAQIDKFWGEKCGCKKFLVKGLNEQTLVKEVEDVLKNFALNVDEKIKKKLKKINPQSFLLDLFDEILKENVLNEELYNLHGEIGNEENFIKKVFSFFEILYDYVVAGIYKENFKEKSLYLKVNYPCPHTIKNYIKEDIISLTNNPEILNNINVKIFNSFNLKNQNDNISLNKTSFKFFYENSYNYGVFIYHKRKSKYPIVNEILKKGLNILFNVERLINKAVMLSIIDGLTGAFNRRYLEEILAKDFEKFLRYNHIFSIIMMDIDHFKKINDTYGHQAGDEVLKHLVSTVKRTIRSSDVIARYGGEEFCIIAYGTEKDDAIYLAERLRSIIKNSEVIFKNNKITYTVSFGVSTTHKGIKNHEELLRKADTALYRAKNSGRDRVEFEM